MESEGLRSAIILWRPLCPQVKGRAVKIRPKTKDWLKGLQEEIIRKRDSVASVSPTANSCLLEENFDFTSLDYESEGESLCQDLPLRVVRWADEAFSQHESFKSPSETPLGKVPESPGSAGSLSRLELGGIHVDGCCLQC